MDVAFLCLEDFPCLFLTMCRCLRSDEEASECGRHETSIGVRFFGLFTCGLERGLADVAGRSLVKGSLLYEYGFSLFCCSV